MIKNLSLLALLAATGLNGSGGFTFGGDGDRLLVPVDLDVSTTADPLVAVTEAATWAGNPAWNTFSIGSIRPDVDNEGWNGSIDQAFVFDEALSAAQLTQMRNLGVVPEAGESMIVLCGLSGLLLGLRRRTRR